MKKAAVIKRQPLGIEGNPTPESINTCAGVDLAYWEQDGEPYGVCSIIVIDADPKEVIKKVHSMGKISVPYVAGFLAFRELPLIIEAAKSWKRSRMCFCLKATGICITTIWALPPMLLFSR